MGLDADIKAIYADGTMSARQRLDARDALIVRPELAPALPWNIVDGDVSVRVTRIEKYKPTANDRLGWEVVYTATKAGLDVPVSMPHRIINPPCLVPDAAGAVKRDKVVDGAKVGELSYREDPIAALGSVIVDTVRSVAAKK